MTHYQNQDFFMPDSSGDKSQEKSQKSQSLNQTPQLVPDTASVDDKILKNFGDLTLKPDQYPRSSNSQQSRISKRQLKRRNDLSNTFVRRNFRDGTKEQRDKRKHDEKSRLSNLSYKDNTSQNLFSQEGGQKENFAPIFSKRRLSPVLAANHLELIAEERQRRTRDMRK